MVIQYFFALFLPVVSAMFPFASPVSTLEPIADAEGIACERPAFTGSRITKGFQLQSISDTVVADFNRDGRPDIANQSSPFQVLTVQFGTGNGYFGQPVILDPSSPAGSVTSADFNNDGNADLLTSVKIYLGTGTGTFFPPQTLPVSVNAGLISTADFNGDDNADFAGLRFSTNNIDVFYGDGTGQFAPATSVTFPANIDSYVVVDFNKDGISDLVATLTNNSIAVTLGSSTGVFSTPAVFPVGGAGIASRLAVGDVDGDLDLDVVTSNVEFFSDTKITTLLNNGSGTLVAQPQFLESSSNLVRIALEDINFDNKLDLLATNTSGVLVRRFGNNDGTFQTSRRLPGIPGQTEMFFEDFTGDGIRDLGVNGTGVGSPMFGVIVNDAMGNLGPEQIDITPADSGPVGMAQADFNEDGKTDVVVIGETGLVWIAFGNGTGGFASPISITVTRTPRAVMTVDLNNDGNQDIFVVVQNAAEQSARILTFFGNGNGTFQVPVESIQIADFRGAKMPVLIDFDRDGSLDLATPSMSNNRVQILKGFSNGGFSHQRVIDFNGAARSMTSGDFDQDGFKDLAVLSGSVFVFLNNGDFLPTAIGAFPAGQTTSHIISADFNEDNIPDLATTTDTISGGIGNPGKAVILLGAGNGGFGAPTEYLIGRGAAQMETADFDGDGHRDLAVANSGYNLGSAADTRVTVMYGDGAGTFPRIQDVAAANFPKGIGVMDLDSDGDIDIVTPDWGQTRLTLLKNVCLNAPPALQQLNAGADVQVTEEDASNVTVNLTVTLSAASTVPVRTRYYTAPIAGVPGIQEGELLTSDTDTLTTTGGRDYIPANGTLVFAPGETSKTVQFTVRGDLIDEFDEYVGFYLADPINASIGDNKAVIRIIDNDGPPVISIGNVSANEGNSGDTPFAVPVTVSAISEKPITVHYATGGGTATPHVDYRVAQAAFTLPAGQLTGAIPVNVIGDLTVETNETFGVQLSEPFNATIGNASATVTIANDDVGGSVQFSTGTYSGSETSGLIPVTVTRTGGIGGGVSVRFRTQAGTATPGQDYVEQTTTVQFGDNETSKTVNVEALRDDLDEPNETVNLILDQPAGVTIGSPSTAVLTLVDFENPPDLTIVDAQILEGNSGTTILKIFVNLSRPTQRPVTVNYATADVTATAGTDYDAASGTFTLDPGVTHKPIEIVLHGDTIYELDETFQVNLSAAVNANLVDNQAIGKIVNDEASTVSTLSFVSINQAGTGSANSDSLEPSLSANGKIIAFESFASNIAGTDTNGTRDIYVRDTEAGQSRLVSINAAGTNSGNCDSRKPLVSANGRYVAFISCATDLVPAAANLGGLEGYGVYVRDLQTNQTRPVSLTSAGTLASADPYAMSADGRYIVFQSNDQGVTATPDTANTSDIFVRDMVSNVTQLITINAAGTATGNAPSGNGFSDRDIKMTPDGRYVLFPSTATNLVNLPTTGGTNTYVRDLVSQTTTAVSVNSAGTAVVGSGPGGSISDNGRYVFFPSVSNAITPTDTNTTADVFRRDMQLGTTVLVSFNNAGTAPANAGSYYPRGSASGRYVTFISVASNLTLTPDTNTFPDIYWRDVESGHNRLVTVNAAGTNAANQFSDFPKISADGQNVAFKSAATDLVGAGVDNNLSFDQYLRQVDNGRTYLVSGNQGGTSAGNQATLDSVMSADGSVVSFATSSTNLLPNDLNGLGSDVFAFSVIEPDIVRSAPFDFDGDGKTDIGIVRPGAAAEWWINRSSTGQTFASQFGAPTDVIVPADYTGDGKADIAFFRPSSGEWYVLRSEDFSFFAVPFGTNGDIPAPADYDADGKDDFALFRPSSATWYISPSSGAPTRIVQFGATGDAPVVADYDGDGKADIGIFRQAAGGAEWWIERSTAGLLSIQFGASTDKAVQGDYTGDGKADIAIWRPSTGDWLILRSEDFSFYGLPFGTNGDVVAPGDYDGDGKFDVTVFRPSSATWFIARSTAGIQIVQFGATGDRPLPNAFVP